MPLSEKEKERNPLKKRYSTVIGSSNVKWLRIGTDMLFIIISTGDELLRNVNIDDLEWPWTLKIGCFSVFLPFRAATRISRANCAEMAGDRPRQSAYDIFSIECRFQQFKSEPSRFKEACTRVCQQLSTLMTLNSKNRGFQWFLAIFSCKRVNCDKMDGDRLRLPANRNCYRLSRVSWALARFRVNFYYHILREICNNTVI